MPSAESLLRVLSEQFADGIANVDAHIGENRNYGAGIGPHDEDDQIDALADAVQRRADMPGTLYTVKSHPSKTAYPGGQAADLVLEADGTTVFTEAKLFRFQRANGDPSVEGFAKVFNPYQDHNPRSFVHDVEKLARSEVATQKGFVGIYYRPTSGAGSDITGTVIAEKFASDVDQWTEQTINVVSVSQFDGLQHDIHSRGAVLTWILDKETKQWF